MARGRRAAPAQSKVIQGVFRADRHTHGQKVEIRLPTCPKWLGKAAKEHWTTLGPILERAGLISIADADSFAGYCDSMAKFSEITERLQTIDDLMMPTPQGFMVQSVLFTIRNKLLEQVMKGGDKFGLSPAARSGIKSQPQQQLPLDGWGDV
jgi:P27 family predicted phage terminase small subunit